MPQSPALKELLFVIRQHAGYQDLLRAVLMPNLPRYKKSENKTIEQIGTEFLFASGQAEQHKNWLAVLSGSPILGDNDNPN